MQLKEGLYELERSVQNDAPDRRVKYDWTKRPQFEAGTRFTIHMSHRNASIIEGVTCYPECHQVYIRTAKSGPGGNLVSVGSLPIDGEIDYHPQCSSFVKAILEALRPIEVDTFDKLFAKHERNLHVGEYGRAVLKWLAQEGHVSLDMLEQAFNMAEDYSIFDAIGEPDE